MCYKRNNNEPVENDVNVTVTIGDVKVEFSGSVETVTPSVMNFLLKQVPSMDLARKILLNYAAQGSLRHIPLSSRSHQRVLVWS